MAHWRRVGAVDVSKRSGRRWWPARFGLTIVLVTILLAAGAVAYAHWTERLVVDTALGNGTIDLSATDDPDFSFFCLASPQSCSPAFITHQVTFQNTGTVPVKAFLDWNAASTTYCELFDVTMKVTGGGATLYSGGLCALLTAGPVQVSPVTHLDPAPPAAESVTVDITVTPDPTEVTWACPVTMNLTATTSWAQWTPAFVGWTTTEAPEGFLIQMEAQTPGRIIVDKVTLPPGEAQSFSFNASWGGGTSFSLADQTAPYDSGSLLAGNYSVAETVPAGWSLASATCDDGSSPAAIGLAAGETVTCTFTDAKDGYLTRVGTPWRLTLNPSTGHFGLTNIGLGYLLTVSISDGPSSTGPWAVWTGFPGTRFSPGSSVVGSHPDYVGPFVEIRYSIRGVEQTPIVLDFSP